MAVALAAIASGDVEQLAEMLVDVGPRVLHVVALTGGPGMGKSTTLEALGRRLLDRGVDARSVSADDLHRGSPFAVLTDLLGLERVRLPRPDTVDRIVTALESSCRSGALALCVDDAHRADPDSLHVLARLPDLVPDLPLLIVLAYRTAPERSALVALTGGAEVITVEVAGLTPAAAERLVCARYGAAPDPRLRTLVAGTDGNPFHLRALLDDLDRAGAITVSEGEARVAEGDHVVGTSVEAGIRAHLGLLDPPTRELLQVLAVWGGSADPATIADVMRSPPMTPVARTHPAVEAGILGWTIDDRLAFTHDLYRDVVLADLDAPVLRALHAACIATLRRSGAGAPALAQHATRARSPDVADTLRAAAADLEHAPAHSAELLGAAADILGDAEGADELAVERAGALAISGEVEAAERVARERLARSSDPATHAALRQITLFCLISGAQVDAALDEIDAVAARAPAPAGATLTDVRRWVVLLGGRQALKGPPTVEASSTSGLVTDALELFLTARPEEGYDRADRASTAGEGHTRPWRDGPTAAVWPAYLALHVHGPGRARALSLEARRRAQSAGRLWLTPYHQSVSAGINFYGGAWDDALAELESGLEAAEATGTAWTSLPTATRLQILVRRGDLDRADETLRRWRIRALPEQFGLPQVALAEVLLLEAREQQEEAAELAERAWRRALDSGRVVWPLIAGPEVMRVAQAVGDVELAGRVARDTAAVPLDQARAMAPAARLVAAIVARDPDEAAVAALDHRAVGHVPGEVTAWEETACLAAANGHADVARTAAARCTALAAPLGATTVERRLSARLRRLDVRLGSRGARGRPRTGWASLTPTELRIAELVGRGLTSPQVAARLYISPRTVQTHISQILRKLGLRSRVELAASLSRRPDPR